MEAADHDAPAPIVRLPRPSDLDFIEASWLQSYRDGLIKYLTPAPPTLVYFAGQRQLIRSLLARPTVAARIVAAAEYDDAILGWIVAEAPSTVHYVYVKHSMRRMGVANMLLGSLGLLPATLVYSHVTRVAKAILAKHPEATFNPWAIV